MRHTAGSEREPVRVSICETARHAGQGKAGDAGCAGDIERKGFESKSKASHQHYTQSPQALQSKEQAKQKVEE